MSSIGRRFDQESSSVVSVLSPSGRIRPPERRQADAGSSAKRSPEALVAGRSLRAIAAQRGRSPSRISREVERNGRRDHYRATMSDQAAWERGLRPEPCKLACHSALRRTVSAKLRRKWSPEQIAGWLECRFAGQEQYRVSHETIYKSLYIQAHGVLRKELFEHMRVRRAIRRSRHASLTHDGLGQIRDAVPISEGPPCVEDRAVPGHWEGDLISGARGSHVVTLIGQGRKLPQDLCRSLIWDRGKELGGHRRFTLATDVEIYLCDPHSPWQRSTNENANRLLRQYLPHGIDLSTFSQARLSHIARQLNERPGKTLNYRSPAEMSAKAVALTD